MLISEHMTPVMRVDPSGYLWKWVEDVIDAIGDFCNSWKDGMENAANYDPYDDEGLLSEFSSFWSPFVETIFDTFGYTGLERNILRTIYNGPGLIGDGLTWASSFKYYWENSNGNVVTFASGIYYEFIFQAVPDLVFQGLIVAAVGITVASGGTVIAAYLGVSVTAGAVISGVAVAGFAFMFTGEMEDIGRQTLKDYLDMLGE